MRNDERSVWMWSGCGCGWDVDENIIMGICVNKKM